MANLKAVMRLFRRFTPSTNEDVMVMVSTSQQMTMSFGLAFGWLITAYFLGDLPQSNRAAVTASRHHSFLALAVLTMVLSSAL